MKALAIIVVLATTAQADKSSTTAVALSGTGAGISGTLVLASFFVGNGNNDINTPLFLTGIGTSIVTPSLGQIYAGEYLTIGMGVRAAAGTLAAIAFFTQEETVKCDDGIHNDCKSLKGAGLALLGLAAIGYIGGMAYDVQDAPDAATRANQHGSVTLAPLAFPHGAGFGVAGRF